MGIKSLFGIRGARDKPEAVASLLVHLCRYVGKVAVLEEGMKYQQIGIPPEEGGDLYLVNGNLCKLKGAGLFAGKERTGQEPPDGRQFRQGDYGLGL